MLVRPDKGDSPIYYFSRIRVLIAGVFLFLVLFPLSILADDESASFQRYSANDGLSLNSINRIIQDSRGFLWIGTEDGLDRYDGRGFINYSSDPDDPDSLLSSFIIDIAEDKEGLIWFVTTEGVDIYDHNSKTFGHLKKYPELKKTINKIDITRFLIDKDGDIWMGSFSQGIIRFNKSSGKITRYLNKGQVFDRSVMCFYQDKDGLIYFGGFNGIKKINPVTEVVSDVIIQKKGEKTISLEYINDIVIDNNRNLWMASYSYGLYRYSLNTKEFKHFVPGLNDSNSLPSYVVTCLALDKGGALWAGTEEEGLVNFDLSEGKFDRFQRDNYDSNSLGSNNISDILFDRSGTFWIATKGGGLNKMQESSKVFKHYNVSQESKSELTSNDIFALLKDSSDIVWIGTADRGLNSFDLKTKKYKHHKFYRSKEEKSPINAIMALCEDSQGRLWVGTTGYGLWIYDRASGKATPFHKDKNKNGIEGYNINHIMEDSFGDIWVATASWGLYRLHNDSGKWSHYNYSSKDPQSLSSVTVYRVFEDSKKRIWLGMYRGVNRFDRETGKFIRYMSENSDGVILPEKDVLGIIEDHNSNIWFGTWGVGILKLDLKNKKVITIRKKDGLANDSIYGFLMDREGNLWASSNKGIAHINYKTLEIEKYKVEDGLQSDEFNAGAYYQAKDGEMYFGGVNGFNSFIPEKVREREKNLVPPPVEIISLKVFNKSVSLGKDTDDIKFRENSLGEKILELNYKKNFITLEFVALDFTKPSDNQYAYKLDPVNQDWVHLENRNLVDLTLNPGEYTLIVNGSNNDGVWNEKGVSIKIIVNPPFFQTFWFRALISILVASLVSLYVYLHIRSIRKQRDTLKSEVEARTQDLNEKNQELEAQALSLERRKVLLEESNEELQVRNKEMESFCYTVSHDLRAPLRHISGYNEIIRDMYSDGLQEEAKDFMGRINSSANRMNEMIESFLWLSRANRQEMNPVDLDMSKMAKDVIEEIKNFEPDREVKISIADGLQCQGDFRLIRVVLENLFSNAWKYTRKTEHPEISFFETEYNNKKVFCVKDNGAGFDPENSSKLFHAFERLHNEKIFEGMGIGLSTVDKIIKRHGGRIFAEGEPDKGASFFFYVSPTTEQ